MMPPTSLSIYVVSGKTGRTNLINSLVPHAGIFFTTMGVIEGRGLAGGLDKLRSNFASTFVGGSVFWPVVNMINFRFVPSTHRLLYVNGCGLVWNAFLR
jgi:hypothetical protein